MKRVRLTAGAMLSGAALAALGIIVAAGPASASAAPAPTVTIVDGGDNYINASEITGVTIQGTYVPSGAPIGDRVTVRVLASASCDPNATPTTQWVDATLTGSNFSVTLDLSDAAQNPDFPEGGAMCAQARARYPGEVTWSPMASSNNRPVKDTIVLAGTVSIFDPDGRGYLNAAELGVDPTGLTGIWDDNDASDATGAQVWFADQATSTIPAASCGKFPASMTASPSSISAGGTDPDFPLTKACGTAMTEGGEITFNAQWTDAAGNTSPIATTAPFPGGSVIKDTTAPVTPIVRIDGVPISGRNIINLSNYRDVPVEVTWSDGDIDYIDVTVDDADALTATLTQRRDPIDDLPGAPSTTTFPFDTISLTDCMPNIENPGATSPDCILATARLTDFAGNLSAIDADVAMKDTLAPAKPVLQFVPDVLNDINDSVTQLEITGEKYASVWVRVSDEDPGSPDMTNIAPLPGPPYDLPTFSLSASGFGALDVDVTPLADGVLDAEVYLIDPWQNRGLARTTIATKDFTVSSMTLLSPVNGSLNSKWVTFSGVAEFNGTACASCKVKVHQRNNPNFNHPDNIAFVEATTDSNGRFSVLYRYLKSGTMKVFFRATDTSNPLNPINGRPSEVSVFDVDVVEPTVGFQTPNESIYMPGDPVIVRGTANDDFSGVLGVEVQVYPLANPSLDTSNPSQPVLRPNKPLYTSERPANCPACPTKNVEWSFDLSNLPTGRYTVEVYSVDRAGQRSITRPQMSFTKL
ncbi:MAG: hypothetical protein ACLGH3_06775 [Actinomycetota bacterium]